MPSSNKEDLDHLLSSQTKEDVLFAKHQRADEGGAEEVRMMIMGPDPAQDNLTVHKLLSDTEAPVTQLAEESLGSSMSKRLGLVCGSYG